MLTKQDLNAIGNLIDDRLESKLEEKLSPIRKDIKSIKQNVRKLRSDLTTTIDYFDKVTDTTKNAVAKTREDVNLPKLNFV